MGQKRNKYCPYKKTCSGICYGSQPCDFADAFDEMARSMVWWKKKARALEQKLKQTNGLEPRFYGRYVFSPCKNGFNGKTSWWLSKKDCTVAIYCFTAGTAAEVDAQLSVGGGQAYIQMFEERTRGSISRAEKAPERWRSK